MASDAALQKALKDAREGRLDAALASVRIMVQRDPKDWSAVQVYAMLLCDAGQFTQAIHHFARVVTVVPDAAPLRNNYANALLAAGRARDAVDEWRAALRADPTYRMAYLGLTRALIECGDADAAVRDGERGLALHPDWPRLAHNMANALEAAMRVDESVTLLKSTLAHHPKEGWLRSRTMQALNYVDVPLKESVAAHREFLACATGSCEHARTDSNRDRPLSIGILSGDMRTHSVAYFALPFIERREPGSSLTIFSIGVAKEADPMRARIRSLADEWVELSGAVDSAIDREIRRRNIDVLIELGGHTAGGRLSALDSAPAPVIISAIGYPNTSGHRAVGWRIVDAITDPLSEPAQCTEQLLRIDPCFLCYAPPANTPERVMPPFDGPIIFGSFNLATKISPRCARMWADVVRAVPGSRLLIKSQAIADPGARERLLVMLETAGIARERVDVIPTMATLGEHLACYSRVHIALDTVPYNGTTTTCEALWMGVPVIALMGDRHSARVGASLLAAAGHPEWVAATPAEFTTIAAALASDRTRLGSLRGSLPGSLAASALCDQPKYASAFAKAIRHAWQQPRE
ncbi:MAG: tetratricopeptide repeat protein [Phycisphaerales bacterium]|nr:tetratricopeptide repeat protein [Phycisphaerales bacterium]